MSVSKALELFLLVAAVFGTLYKLTQIETAIYRQIDAVKDATSQRLNDLKGRLDLQDKDKEHQAYVINELNNKLDHKFNRLHSGQKDIQAFLEKRFEFVPRQFFGQPEKPKE